MVLSLYGESNWPVSVSNLSQSSMERERMLQKKDLSGTLNSSRSPSRNLLDSWDEGLSMIGGKIDGDQPSKPKEGQTCIATVGEGRQLSLL